MTSRLFFATKLGAFSLKKLREIRTLHCTMQNRVNSFSFVLRALICVCFCAFCWVAIAPALAKGSAKGVFSDVPPGDPTYDAIVYLKGRQILDGYADGTFRPEKNVNRAEALKIIATAVLNDKAPLKGVSGFDDVPPDAWFAPYVAWAQKQNGIISAPAKAASFHPNRNVTKAEFIKMFLASRKIDPDAFGDIHVALANDVKDPTQWYYPYLRYAVATSMTSVHANGLYEPDRQLTRSDVALLMYRYFRYKDGKRTQALLTETKKDMENVVDMLSKNKVTDASYASVRAVLMARGAHEIAADQTVVKVAVKTSEGYHSLVLAYQAGLKGDLQDVVKLSKDAWTSGQEAKQLSPDAATLATQLQKYAASFAAEARKHMK